MQKVIISDTSCLILLHNIGELGLLFKLFGTIITTSEVAKEFGLPLPQWVEIKDPIDKKYVSIAKAIVDKGEASAIALAVEYDECLLIVDDLKARKFASNIGLNITGTIGIIVDAKLVGVITSVKDILAEIKKTNFRISPKLEAIILKKAGE
jgi:predicted nucleic acid-binding protein